MINNLIIKQMKFQNFINYKKKKLSYIKLEKLHCNRSAIEIYNLSCVTYQFIDIINWQILCKMKSFKVWKG